ncbi:YlqD family protein [Halobacillus naozhouensis]|uniref:YlqD family protein n=2 Tax=Halobacillus naozhouensis TaxID=554880 RepID=A0ABY8J7H8_9BACI|nr:YlqD family protein [Halobacillus naozhouensis]WFT76715.1 YlqD family protein [Halobacillus naozhouensis]
MRQVLMMQILKRIPVKQVLTAASRQKLTEQFEQDYLRLKQECEQLWFEQKKLEKKQEFSKMEVEKRFSAEIQKRKDKMKRAEHLLGQLEILPDDSELVIDEVDSIVTVEAGDRYEERMLDPQIIIKDGIVIRAR